MEIASIGILTAFLAGAISFLSPCVLPLVPGYISYIAGNTAVADRSPIIAQSRIVALLLSLCFVLGFSTVFVALGASATLVSRLLLSYRLEANLIGGIVVIVFGIFTTGLIRFPWMDRDIRFHGAIQGGRPAGAYLLGLAFGFGWTPCIGPVLGAILTVSAVSATASGGVVLLGVYSIGLGLPFVLSALFVRGLSDRLKRMRLAGRWLQIAAGVIMIVMGVAMVTGQLSLFAFWLLQTFPIFSQIG
ncbi:cytochrome C biogenesis protein [Devosia limi DSM 17137]|uniref:Cytochrome C biogenesis protein n=1 Tax=Devosia limi DSM 17137 TaxID=1121477 RepID=A0A0F5LQQ6_9HYPH|nr:cytochrome c biogenesis protein CcdA [Devosia limi]KKB84663.1 cytochrome C biogenesis protein [Devosia limi DSM 17137]SHF55188.1 cytochrome c-type biogenesis protein [Devosia limi DSM 17137]